MQQHYTYRRELKIHWYSTTQAWKENKNVFKRKNSNDREINMNLK